MNDKDNELKFDEIWKDVPGFDGDYKASTRGRIKSFKGNTPIIMSLHTNKRTGYVYVGLCKDGEVHTTTVHRVVAETFIPNPDNLPCINHKDENKENNYIENLEWCSYQYNLTYGTHTERAKETRKARGSDKFLYKYSIENRDYINKRIKETQGKRVAKIDKNSGEVLKIYDSISDAEKENKCSHVSECTRNVRNESGGYIWQLEEDIENNENCIVDAMNRILSAKTICRKTMNKGKVIVQYDLDENEINRFRSIKEASLFTGCKESGISACIHGRQQKSAGYRWRLE